MDEHKPMWEYQAHFRICAMSDAQKVFGLLDPGFQPDVLLVGLREQRDAPAHANPAVTVEPADHPFFQPDTFADVADKAEALEQADPERNLLHTHPQAHASHLRTIHLRAVRNAVIQSLAPHTDRTGCAYFVSAPVRVKGYLVCVVLGLQREVMSRYYALDRQHVERWSMPTSLTDAVIHEFLEVVSDRLNYADPGAALWIIRQDYEEVLRAAGNYLMFYPAYAGGNYDGRHGVYAACNRLAALRYEGLESSGLMIVARQDHPNIRMKLEFSAPVPLDNHRAVRKLLQSTSDNLGLLTDSAMVYGLAEVWGEYESAGEDLFTIKFLGRYTWDLIHDGKILMRVTHGQPRLPRPPLNEEKLRRDLPRVFAGIDPEDVNQLSRLAHTASRVTKGAMLVVHAYAEAEAQRLASQCTRIHPLKLTPEVLRLVASIDGAILIDPQGICYAIGVILDGMATEKGDRSRGSRYNSAVRYIEFQIQPCLAIVVSEDGYVDFVPDLRPQIYRSSIETRLARLRRMAQAPSVDIADYHETMDWLVDHSFYLSAGDCREINDLREGIEQQLASAVLPQMVMGYPTFTPHDELDDSYFLEKSA